MNAASDVAKAFRLEGRRALVTGAGGGLGKVFSIALAAMGAEVVCAGIDGDSVERTAAEIGGAASGLQVDVTDEASVAALAAALDGAPLHVLINNAGVAPAFARVHESAVADWDRSIDVNLRGAFLCTRALLPAMLGAGGGSIINLTSIVGVRGIDPGMVRQGSAANYVAAKAGLIGLTKQLAVEYGRDGIRVNAIAPGFHGGTRLGRHYGLDGDGIAEMMRRATALSPLRRIGEADELAGLVVYLASDASTFLTGQVIAHDGGATAW
jgi:3-oxoacyl-[acyl-carrier protein] reductase